MKNEDIAKIVHEANRAYCEALGDFSQEPWANAPEEIKDSVIAGVEFRKVNPKATPKDMHDNWVKQKASEGYEFGKEKNAFRKTHPCMVEYKELPDEQKLIDDLFSSIVGVFTDD